jgi:hypothetical protein
MFAKGESVTELVYGGVSTRRAYIADMKALGWTLTASARINNRMYRLTFRCDR